MATLADRRGISLSCRLRRLWFSDTAPVEIVSALSALFWGVSLAIPGDTFAFRASYYKPMADLAPEWAWAVGFLALGMLQLVGVLSQATCGRACRWLMGCLAVMAWVAISCTVSMRWPPSAGSMPHLVLALAALWAFVRLGERRPNGYS